MIRFINHVIAKDTSMDSLVYVEQTLFARVTLAVLVVLGTFSYSAKAEDGPTWVHLVSPHLECGEAESDYDDIVEGINKLKNEEIRVITTERNILSSREKEDRQYGGTGDFVSCYLIFSPDVPKAISLGFGRGGNCGNEYKIRTH